jgi:hypothetical protein
MLWRAHSCVPRRHSCRCLLLFLESDYYCYSFVADGVSRRNLAAFAPLLFQGTT